MVTVRFPQGVAKVEHLVWDVEDELLKWKLNTRFGQGFVAQSPSYYPTPDIAAATEAAQRLGGEVVEADVVELPKDAIA